MVRGRTTGERGIRAQATGREVGGVWQSARRPPSIASIHVARILCSAAGCCATASSAWQRDSSSFKHLEEALPTGAEQKGDIFCWKGESECCFWSHQKNQNRNKYYYEVMRQTIIKNGCKASSRFPWFSTCLILDASLAQNDGEESDVDFTENSAITARSVERNSSAYRPPDGLTLDTMLPVATY